MQHFITGPVLGGITRHLLTGAGGWAMANGYADAATVETIIGGAVALVGVVWSAQAKRFAR